MIKSLDDIKVGDILARPNSQYPKRVLAKVDEVVALSCSNGSVPTDGVGAWYTLHQLQREQYSLRKGPVKMTMDKLNKLMRKHVGHDVEIVEKL